MISILFLGRTQFDSRSRKYIAACEKLNVKFEITDLSESENRLNFAWKFFQFSKQIFRKYKSNSPTLFIAADVFSLPVALFFFFSKSVPFVFDARELNSEVAAFESQFFKKLFWGFIERLGFLFGEKVVTVNQSLQLEFEKKYQRKSEVMFNYPHEFSELSANKIRLHFEFSESDFIWIFQGAVQSGRGFEDAVAFISKRPENEKLVVIGEMKTQLKPDQTNRIFMTGEIPNSDLLSWTSSADAGLVLIRSNAKSYQLSLPNKFFEFVFAELPILCYDLKEMTALISIYHCGLTGAENELQTKADELIKNKSYFISGSQKLKNKLSQIDQISMLSEWIGKSLE